MIQVQRHINTNTNTNTTITDIYNNIINYLKNKKNTNSNSNTNNTNRNLSFVLLKDITFSNQLLLVLLLSLGIRRYD